MTAKTLMIQGTGSSVGKSIMVAAMCRIMRQDGYRVAPFKSQNMALNSFVTIDGHEMGRAQVVQAEAAGLEPHVDMNPVLIKPEADAKSQVVVMGRPWKTLSAYDYYKYSSELFSIMEKAFKRLSAEYDVIVIEGAGSPAEINLRKTEIVNMAVARMAGSPVMLVGDIDKGGVFAQLVGTLVLLEEEERKFVKGLIINKFRGDINILKPGLSILEERAGVPVLGVVPYYHDIDINEEDSIHRAAGEESQSRIEIAVIHLPRISNSTDFEPLQQEKGVHLRYITNVRQLGCPDLIIIPGSKSTIADLKHIKEIGLATAIQEASGRGTAVIGICGGFQMLGKSIEDPRQVESSETKIEGLGLLDVTTMFEGEKTTHQVKAEVIGDKGIIRNLQGKTVSGYEIHMGRTQYGDVDNGFRIIQRSADIEEHRDGAVNRSGNVLGTYLHGLFDSEEFRRSLLMNIKPDFRFSVDSQLPSKEEQYDKLAFLVRENLDIEQIYRICRLI